MLTETLDGIIDLLADLGKTVGPYQGQLDEVLKSAHYGLPALWVSFASGAYQPAEVCGPKPPVPHELLWRVLIATSNTAGKTVGQRQALLLVEQVLEALSAHDFDWGRLWPVSVDEVINGSGVSAYAIYFQLDEIQDITRGTI